MSRMLRSRGAVSVQQETLPADRDQPAQELHPAGSDSATDAPVLPSTKSKLAADVAPFPSPKRKRTQHAATSTPLKRARLAHVDTSGRGKAQSHIEKAQHTGLHTELRRSARLRGRQPASDRLQSLSEAPVRKATRSQPPSPAPPPAQSALPSTFASAKVAPEEPHPTLPATSDGLQLQRVPLTRKNLAAFEKMAKKKQPNRTSGPSGPTETTGETETSKKTTTTSTTTGFEVQARKNGLLQPFQSKPPANLLDLRERCDQARGTASPTESQYGEFVEAVETAPNEATLLVRMGGLCLKSHPGEQYSDAYNQAFTNFPKSAGFNAGLSVPQPDFVEGFRRDAFDPFDPDEHIPGAVLYADNSYSITLPHIAGEWKAPGKDMVQARLQSAYDGAAMVYARKQALALVGNADPPGEAHVTTFTTDGTTLNQFAHYAVPTANGQSKYHQYPVSVSNLTASLQGLKDGRRRLRNAQDYAKHQASELKSQLQEHWQQRSGAGPSVAVFGSATAVTVTGGALQNNPVATAPVDGPAVDLADGFVVVSASGSHAGSSQGQKRRASSPPQKADTRHSPRRRTKPD